MCKLSALEPEGKPFIFLRKEPMRVLNVFALAVIVYKYQHSVVARGIMQYVYISHRQCDCDPP